MDLGLAGRTAVVTGGSKGIGLAIVSELVAEGVLVTAGARKFPGDAAAGVRTVEVDLSTPDGPQRLVDDAVSAYGRLDLLVNNVGAAHPRTGGFLSITDEDWLATLTLDLLATVRASRAALPHLLESRGSIVTVCSVNATLPDPLVMDYSAAKSALASFCKSLSKEFGPQGVRVNTVSPGPVATDLWLGKDGVAATVGSSAGVDPEAVAAQAAGGSVTGRFSTPEEVAALVVMVASDRAGNVTGADFVIDGGLVSTL
ncbi:oxidoreductase [Actinoplanes friuliensis]|uniref:Short-chain dehydrogenase/reductase SDR n=1 Tax=Actinoplanes friuliensis DSM 7358 TaxID=1246995 RepID=U5VSW1_9ACTN|nr:oxidoreductase [Actinoplanes friuliensis]AGZ38815.1 short-chain dehydrogenase/reductase SDR [Actinoplanes friuliensis DSM 7358]